MADDTFPEGIVPGALIRVTKTWPNGGPVFIYEGRLLAAGAHIGSGHPTWVRFNVLLGDEGEAWRTALFPGRQGETIHVEVLAPPVPPQPDSALLLGNSGAWARVATGIEEGRYYEYTELMAKDRTQPLVTITWQELYDRDPTVQPIPSGAHWRIAQGLLYAFREMAHDDHGTTVNVADCTRKPCIAIHRMLIDHGRPRPGGATP